jgi:phosphatidate phosphatase APP1
MKPRNRPIASNLKPNQQVSMFPSLGYFDESRDCWKILAHGRVYCTDSIPLGTRILLRGLKRAMKATPEQLASDLFQQRIGGFLAKPIAGKRIVLKIGDHKYILRKRTRGNGVFYGVLKIPADQLHLVTRSVSEEVDITTRSVSEEADITTRSVSEEADSRPTPSRSVPIQIVRPFASMEYQDFPTSHVHLVNRRGLSVISDIDDTIKATEATCRREMLANTFLRPFEVVEGMSEVYQAWYAEGVDFHYVSSSPWQLYQPLAELCISRRFPPGSMHLRYFRMRDEMLKRFRPVRNNKKVGIIAAILKWLPERRFILIGDSGEKDPEIYRFLAKRFSQQVVAILIRNLDTRPLDVKRTRKLYSVAKHCEVRVYAHANQIADVSQRYL